tara:strand:+ start:242 stop:2134 length:1893 start_codon:yes stop_codon:yes gene_type:complete
MSLNIFENHRLDFEVSLIKLDRVDRSGTITDEVVDTIKIEQSAILDLEINESSITMGAQGSITLNNKFNIFERLKISTNSPNDLYVAINIKDTELNDSDIKDTDKVITVVGLVNSAVAGSKDIIDNILIFEWEEAFVAATRKTNLNFFAHEFTHNKHSPRIDDKPGVISQVDVLNLADRFYDNIYKLKSEDMESITVTPTPDAFPNVKHELKTTKGFSESIYDALNHMLNESTVGSGGEVGKIPYFRFVNTLDSAGKVKRKLKFDAFITDEHVELIQTVLKGDKKGDFSNVYIEKFSTGPTADVSPLDPNITIYNKIEQYNITRADVGRLRVKVWGDYQIERDTTYTPDTGPIETTLIHFSEIERDYLKRDFGGANVNVNIPLLDPSEIQVFSVSPESLSTNTIANRSVLQQKNLIANTVIKSFLTINETISFTSKGSVIRQPNKFIWIERDASLEEEAYHKLWYVNSVTHKFKDGKYTTDIIATKLFGDTTGGAIDTAVSDAKQKKVNDLPTGKVYDPIFTTTPTPGDDKIFGHERDTSTGRQKRKNQEFLDMMDDMGYSGNKTNGSGKPEWERKTNELGDDYYIKTDGSGEIKPLDEFKLGEGFQIGGGNFNMHNILLNIKRARHEPK